MTLRRMVPVFVARYASLTLTAVALLVASTGCTREESREPPTPVAPGGLIEVVGTLVALKDDRPVDGGIDLTLETTQGVREVVHVPSIFIVPPRDSVRAMHEVVDAAKIGDRLRVRGVRDESGAFRAAVLEKIAP